MLKILTWNINKAAYVRRELWEYLKRDDFDIALLQEVYLIPGELKKYFFVKRGEMTAILVRKNRDRTIENSLFDGRKFNSKVALGDEEKIIFSKPRLSNHLPLKVEITS